MNKIELCDTINPSLVSVKPKTVQPAPVAKKLNLDTRTINMYAQLFSALQQHFQFCDFSAGNYILRQSLLKIADMDNAYLRLYSDDGTTFVRAAEIESRVRAEYPNTKGIKFTKV